MALTASGEKQILEHIGQVDLTAAESIEKGDLVTADGYKADANNSRFAEFVALQNASSGSKFQAARIAVIDGMSGGAGAGTVLYLSDTAGDCSESIGTVPQVVGVELSATQALFAPGYSGVSTLLFLPDNKYLYFGTGLDVKITWDGTNLIIAAAADDTLIEIGDAAATQLSFDVKWYGNDANGASYLYMDASANSIYTVGIELLIDGQIYHKTSPTTLTTAGNQTLTTAQMTAGYLLRDPNGGDVTDTTPTAAQIVAAIPNCQTNSSFLWIVKNTADAAETITIAGGTGVTITGTATIAQNNTKIFLVVVTDPTSGSEAVTIYSIGTLVH